MPVLVCIRLLFFLLRACPWLSISWELTVQPKLIVRGCAHGRGASHQVETLYSLGDLFPACLPCTLKMKSLRRKISQPGPPGELLKKLAFNE